jgi:hypothetical protein
MMAADLIRRWFVFGAHADRSVDIADSENSTLIARVPPDLAQRVIEAHEAECDRVEAEMRAVFTPGAAWLQWCDVEYMPVPRCDRCKWWPPPPGDNFSLRACPRLGIATACDFGCVQFEAKGGK